MKRLAIVVLMVIAVAVPAFTAVDHTAPVISFTTANDATLVSDPAAQRSDAVPLEVTGTANDGNTGVRQVWVTWVRCGLPPDAVGCTNVPIPDVEPGPSVVALTCTDSTRQRCTWRATAPTTPGFYYVYAYGEDRSGNQSGLDRYIRVRVL